MRKKHFVNIEAPHRPFCVANVRMIQKGFDTVEDKDQVTCRLCLMRLGVIEDTRGNWDNRIK